MDVHTQATSCMKNESWILKLVTLQQRERELVKDVTAMANSRESRTYNFGIEDKTILGINPELFRKAMQQIIYSRTDPPVSIGLNQYRGRPYF